MSGCPAWQPREIALSRSTAVMALRSKAVLPLDCKTLTPTTSPVGTNCIDNTDTMPLRALGGRVQRVMTAARNRCGHHIREGWAHLHRKPLCLRRQGSRAPRGSALPTAPHPVPARALRCCDLSWLGLSRWLRGSVRALVWPPVSVWRLGLRLWRWLGFWLGSQCLCLNQAGLNGLNAGSGRDHLTGTRPTNHQHQYHPAMQCRGSARQAVP